MIMIMVVIKKVKSREELFKNDRIILMFDFGLVMFVYVWYKIISILISWYCWFFLYVKCKMVKRLINILDNDNNVWFVYVYNIL